MERNPSPPSRGSTRYLLTITLLACLVSGCSSTTIINSNPQGAKVFVDGTYRGVTPYSYSDSKIVGSSTPLKLTKDGYQELNTSLSRSERPDVGAIVGGCFFLFPFLWTMQYDSQHHYDLQLPQPAVTSTTPTAATTTPAQADALASRLKSLKQLLDKGDITQDEYDTLRKRALDDYR